MQGLVGESLLECGTKKMYGKLSLKLRDLNQHLTCVLCGGYYVDATTIIECLHSFCRSCIVNYLATNKCCPKCEVPAHKTRPLLNIRNDKTLQDVVYKLVPTLYDNELSKKRKFHEETGIPMDVDENTIFNESPKNTGKEKSDQLVSVSLEYDDRDVEFKADTEWKKCELSFSKRYLRCVDAVTIATINKLIRKKLLRDDLEIMTFCRGEVLPETYSLMEAANTFSWKSDRPLQLTYMAFAKKNEGETSDIQEKMCESKVEVKTPVNEVTKEEPKRPEENSGYGVNPTVRPEAKSEEMAISEAVVARPDLARMTGSSGYNRVKPPTSHVKFILPKPRVQNVAATRPQAASQNGKNMSFYSVMNVPLIEAVGEMRSKPTTEESRNVAIHNQTGSNNVGSPLVVPKTQVPSASIPPPQPSVVQAQQHPVERTKSINSIANRLQMRQQMQQTNRLAAVRQDTPNLIHRADYDNRPRQVVSVPSQVQQRQFHPMYEGLVPRPGQFRAHDKSPQRFFSPSYKNLTNDEAHSLALECVRNKMRPILPQPGKHQIGSYQQISASPGAKNPTKFIQLEHSRDLPNYAQATEQRHILVQKSRPSPVSRRPDTSPKYAPIQPRNRSPKVQKYASVEGDILSTTRQLASLRQQQKILNEIAAAVAARPNSSFATTESIRAAVSGMTSRMTSPRMSSATIGGPGKVGLGVSLSNTRPRFSLVSPNSPAHHVRAHSNGVVRTPKQNGTSFTELPRIAPNIGFPSLNAPREGNIDIYQNTIAKAKACVREMDLKSKGGASVLTHARASAAPYMVPRVNAPRKIQPKPHQSRPAYPPPIQPVLHRAPVRTPTPPRMAPKPSWNRPPPPPPPAVKSPYSMVPQYRPPSRHFSPPVHRKPEPNVPLQPEQEQPLCLVVRK